MTQMRSGTSSINASHPFEISIIVCHHVGTFIYKFVESVKKSFGVKYEIIVITSDNELALKGIPGCKVMNGDQYPAAKRNQGARISSGRYLAFFDDDVEIEPTCLSNFKRFLDNNPTVGMVYGKLYNMEHRNRFDEAGGFLTSTGFIWSRAGQNDIDFGQYDHHETILAGKSASCMMREELFFKVGGFDEDFEILGEETLVSWMLWLYNQKVCFVYDAVAGHYFNTKWKPADQYYTSKRVNFNGPRNYVSMLLMCLGKENVLKIVPIHATIWMVTGFLMILTGKAVQGFNILKGLWYVFSNLKNVLRKRKHIQSQRLNTDSELFPFIFRNPPKGYYMQRFFRYLKIGLHG